MRTGSRVLFNLTAALLLTFYGVAIFFHLMPMLCPHFRGYAAQESLTPPEGTEAGPKSPASSHARANTPYVACWSGGCGRDAAVLQSGGHHGQCPYVLMVLTPTLAQAFAIILATALFCGFLFLARYRSPHLARNAFSFAPRAPPCLAHS